MFDLARDLAGAFKSNYSEFPNSSIRRKLTLRVYVPEVLIYGRNGNLEQLRNQGLAQPKCLLDEAALDSRRPIRRLIEDDLTRGRSLIAGHSQPNDGHPMRRLSTS